MARPLLGFPRLATGYLRFAVAVAGLELVGDTFIQVQDMTVMSTNVPVFLFTEAFDLLVLSGVPVDAYLASQSQLPPLSAHAGS